MASWWLAVAWRLNSETSSLLEGFSVNLEGASSKASDPKCLWRRLSGALHSQNKLEYLSRKKDSGSLSSSSDSDRSEDEKDDNSDGNEKDQYSDEELFEEADRHAQEANQQRGLAREWQDTAMAEAENDHEDRRFVIFFFRSLPFYN